MRVLHSRNMRLSLALVASGLMVAAATAVEPDSKTAAPATACLIQYETPTGATYSAIVLPAPTLGKIPAVPHDHVVIVDTSASQSGSFRTRSIAMAAEFCRNLPAGDRVRLIASDVAAEELTTEFSAGDNPQLQDAFNRLEDRVPLGSGNIELALQTALSKFAGDRARAIVYIGDGFSTAQLIQTPAMGKLLASLRSAAVPVNSLAIGPRTDLLLLGTLAQHTGGMVIVDEPNVVADQDPQFSDLKAVAAQLVKIAEAPILYPTSLKSEPKISELLPQTLPPVRFDRETVLLGQGVAQGPVKINVVGNVQSKSQSYSWTVGPEDVPGSTAFVAQAWQLAAGTQGLAMPWAGRDLMVRAQHAYQAQLDSLAQAGADALVKKDQPRVAQIAHTLQQLDPTNLDAPYLLQQSRKLKAKPGKSQIILAHAEQQPDGEPQPAIQPRPDEIQPAPEPLDNAVAPLDNTVDPPVARQPAPIPADEFDPTTDRSNPRPGSLLDELEVRRRVREEQLTTDVNLAIEAAHAGARVSYADAQDLLKRQLDTVVTATDISAEVRHALRQRLANSIQQLQNENEQLEQQLASLDRRLSQQEAMRKLMDQAQRDEEKMEQLIDRVRALMNRGFKGDPNAFEDAEAVARVAVELAPYSAAPNQDVFNAEAAGALDKARRLRSLRADKLLATLHQVELSHVPFPDEPPIVWPSPERWQWITENRRKWKSVDLKSYSKKEEKIVSELDRPTSFDFTDESLDGIRETIMERHGFDIVIDKVKLEEESVATDATDITLKVNEIALRNALRLLLDSKNLTYVIENEVMKITTKTDGILKRPLRVYNVGDLVMPINPLFGMGGSQSGGQAGGGGGQFNGQGGGGQFGGGGQGMGGMGGGGMGGGMGGGFADIPPAKVKPQPAAHDPAKPAAPVKDEVSQAAERGQAFAQVQDDATAPRKLTGDTLKNRKKKALTKP